jgi:hypothetical protein
MNSHNPTNVLACAAFPKNGLLLFRVPIDSRVDRHAGGGSDMPDFLRGDGCVKRKAKTILNAQLTAVDLRCTQIEKRNQARIERAALKWPRHDLKPGLCRCTS